MNERESLEKAIEFFDGSTTKLALAIGGGVVRQNVEHWLKSGRARAEFCPAIEQATGGLVRCEDLRPDVQWSVLRNPTTQPAEQGA